MTWYVAHLVMQVEFKSANQSRIPVWENIHLIEAPNEQILRDGCQDIGRAGEGDSDGSFHWNDEPARWVFKGVRKIITIESLDDLANLPGSGCEITYSTLVFSDNNSLENFLQGSEALATIVD
jgi:hypothetical protein